MKIFCSFCFDTELNKYMSSGSHYLVWRELLSIYRMTKPHIYGMEHKNSIIDQGGGENGWGGLCLGRQWTLAGIFVKIMVRLRAVERGPVYTRLEADI